MFTNPNDTQAQPISRLIERINQRLSKDAAFAREHCLLPRLRIGGALPESVTRRHQPRRISAE